MKEKKSSYLVFEKKDDIHIQISKCEYDDIENAESFADSLLDTIKYHDSEIVILTAY